MRTSRTRVLFAFALLAGASALAFLSEACKPKYALCESSRDCAPNFCVAGRCVPASPDAGRLAIQGSERVLVRPRGVRWLPEASEPGAFRGAASELEISLPVWALPRDKQITEAYLLLHRKEGPAFGQATVAVSLRSRLPTERRADGDASWLDRGAPVRVDALSSPWVRLDLLPILRTTSLDSAPILVVRAKDVEGEGMAFYVQTLSDVSASEGESSQEWSPALELYLTEEAPKDAGVDSARGALQNGTRQRDE